MAAHLTIGSKVWVKVDSEWNQAQVLRLNEGSMVVVKTEKGEVKAKPEDLPLQNQDTRGVEVSITSLHDEA